LQRPSLETKLPIQQATGGDKKKEEKKRSTSSKLWGRQTGGQERIKERVNLSYTKSPERERTTPRKKYLKQRGKDKERDIILCFQ